MGVSKICLSRPFLDADLVELSLSITEWHDVAPFLGLSDVEEEEIACDKPTPISQTIAMLRKWRQKSGRNATYGSLASVFRKLSGLDLAETVETLATSAGGCDPPVAAFSVSPLSVKFDPDSFPNTSASDPYVAFLPNFYRHFLNMAIVWLFVLCLAVLLIALVILAVLVMHSGHAITCTCKCTPISGVTDSESESKLVKVQYIGYNIIIYSRARWLTRQGKSWDKCLGMHCSFRPCNWQR